MQDAYVSTTNGGITLQGEPIASGKLDLRTTNGPVTLAVPERAANGYDVDAKTTNGRVSILLHDGTADPAEKTHASFKSNAYDARAIRTVVAIGTTNGGVTVGSE